MPEIFLAGVLWDDSSLCVLLLAASAGTHWSVIIEAGVSHSVSMMVAGAGMLSRTLSSL